MSIEDNMVSTTQTAEELKAAFVPGKDFGFNATLEFEKPSEDDASDLETSTDDEPLVVEKGTEEEST